MKNDVSFLIADTFNFYEHQSSINPNMPMRMLIYSGMIYDSYTEACDDYHRFSSLQQHAPPSLEVSKSRAGLEASVTLSCSAPISEYPFFAI